MARTKTVNSELKKKITQKNLRKENDSETKRPPFFAPRGNLLWAAVLIISGLIFLFNNFGLLPWSIWGFVWRFWPLFLIFGGLHVIFSRSEYRKVFVIQTGLMVMVFIFLTGTAVNIPEFNQWFSNQFPGIQLSKVVRFEDSELRKEIVIGEENYQNVTARKIAMNIPGGDVKVTDSADNFYLKLNSTYFDKMGEPEVVSKLNNGLLGINFATNKDLRLPVGSINKIKYDFSVGSPILATDIALDMGAGRAAVSLERMTLNNFDLKMGAGTADIMVKENAIPSENMTIKVGAGSVYIQIPKNVAVKINHNVGLGNLKVNQTSLNGKGVYQPTSYETIIRNLVLNIEVGAGTVNIETI